MICKKCWADAYMRMVNHPLLSQAEHYRLLLEERKDNPCSEEEQLGADKEVKDDQ